MRVICLDVGERRIGVAVTDPLDITAQGVETIWSKGLEKDVQRVKEICTEYSTNRLVLGLPRNMDGSEGPRSQRCRDFAAELQSVTGIPVVLYDERLTTVTAHSFLSMSGLDSRQHKKHVDELSARLILEDYMKMKKNREEQNG